MGESAWARIRRVAREEAGALHGRLLLADLLVRPWPYVVGSRFRTWVYRAAGFRIGPGTVIWGRLDITGAGDIYRRLTVGASCWLNAPCFLNLDAPITLGDNVAVGHHTVFITAGHRLGPPTRRAGPLDPQPIAVGDGAWIGAGATLLPGVTVGAGAVAAAGAVVAADVPPNTLVGGVPAHVIRALEP